MTPPATVVITTKDRKIELRAAVESCGKQSVPIEILVVDDGSRDGTFDLIRAEFPSVRIVRNETSVGLIVARNQAAHLSSCPIVFSIDDDAVFSTPNVVEQTLHEFDHHRVGAVAIPFINVNQDDIIRQRSPSRDQIHVTDRFIGTAHALRRDVFLKLGGYRQHFVHQGEEGDYCIRMLEAGFVVRLGGSDPIHHFESPRRSFARMDYFGKRNQILYTWHNVPWPYFPFHLAIVAARGFWHGIKLGRPRASWAGVLSGFLQCMTGQIRRSPIEGRTYRLVRRLIRGSMPVEEVEPMLPSRSPIYQKIHDC